MSTDLQEVRKTAWRTIAEFLGVTEPTDVLTGATSLKYLAGDATWKTATSGTVTSVNVTTANGVSATGGPITTTGSFTFTLSAITPSSVSTGALTSSALTAGRVTFAGTSGLLGDSSDFLYNDTTKRITVGSSGAGSQGWVIGHSSNSGESLMWGTDVTPSTTNAVLGTTAGFTFFNCAAGKRVDCRVDNTVAYTVNGNLNVLIGGTSELPMGNAGHLQIAGTSAPTSTFSICHWQPDALGARIEGGHSRGAARGTNTIVQSGDVVFTITGYGANGSTFTNCSSIEYGIDGTPGASADMPGFIKTYTVPDGSGTLTLATYTDSAQRVGFGVTPSAVVSIKAGTAAAGTSPNKIADGTRLTTAEVGVHEVESNHYLTNWKLLRFPIGGPIFDHFADVSNVTTGETDLYTDTLIANTFAINGDKVSGQYAGTFTGAVSSTQQLRAYFGGTLIFDSGALSIGVATDSWDLKIICVRESSSIVRCSATLTTNFATLSSYATYTKVTGLTLSGTNILKVTGQAGGLNAASNQITASLGSVEYRPAVN